MTNINLLQLTRVGTSSCFVYPIAVSNCWTVESIKNAIIDHSDAYLSAEELTVVAHDLLNGREGRNSEKTVYFDLISIPLLEK